MTAMTVRTKRVRVVEARAFCTRCLTYLDEVCEEDVEILIVDHEGNPLARLIRHVEDEDTLTVKLTAD
jgi:hypothetical protein